MLLQPPSITDFEIIKPISRGAFGYAAPIVTLYVRSFLLLNVMICLYPHSFVFPWAVESSPLQFLALA